MPTNDSILIIALFCESGLVGWSGKKELYIVSKHMNKSKYANLDYICTMTETLQHAAIASKVFEDLVMAVTDVRNIQIMLKPGNQEKDG